MSCTQTDHWARPWRMYTTSTASRRDCTEAFLSTTSAVSPPRPWPLPPTSSWSRSSTWTSRCFYTAQVCTRACALRVIKQIVLDASFVEWSHWELPFSWIHWRHRGRRLMLKRETGYQTVSEAHHVCFSLSYFLFFLGLATSNERIYSRHVAWICATPLSMSPWLHRGSITFGLVSWMAWGNDMLFNNIAG